MEPHKSQQAQFISMSLLIGGQVQGVGFRPFVYRLANKYGIRGWVQNRSGEVKIQAQGASEQIDQFIEALTSQAPPLSKPVILDRTSDASSGITQFSIVDSATDEYANIHIPPDYFTCNECLHELSDSSNRRYRYPFINCTQCGPRYTLIKQLPYDRPNTSMASFTLCEACQKEYDNPLDRRFHAEPVACSVCGPALEYRDAELHVTDTGSSLHAAVCALGNGKVIAVKGIGGYHLLCDAQNDEAIKHLRLQKPRPDKPLALMFPVQGGDGLDAIREQVLLDREHEKILTDPIRPIVLSKLKPDSNISSLIAPGLDEIGIMLPYSPLHHLLVNDFAAPLVATSANISGEPVLTDNNEVEKRLSATCHGYLHHDRAILRPADDPVYRVIQHRPRPVRLGRGNAPLELTLPFTLDKTLLAVGGHMKNAIALAWGKRVVISPHIGELSTPRSQMIFEQVINDLQSLYKISADMVLCDAHPAYASTQWAKNSGLPYTNIFHHQAHASAVAGEFPIEDNWLVFTWDGVGYGSDQTLWGGESFYGKPGNWERKTSFRPFYLPGGEKASRQPWRSAASLCWETDIPWNMNIDHLDILHQAWLQKQNCPQTTAVGRLFDAASALTDIVKDTSFEGQGPMMLEAAAKGGTQTPIALPLSLDDYGIWRSDWVDLIPMLLDQTRSVAERANCFHVSMATSLLDQAKLMREHHGSFTVGLSGGVFQNRLLTETVIDLLEYNGFNVHLPEQVPCNDGGLCFGQIIEGALRDNNLCHI